MVQIPAMKIKTITEKQPYLLYGISLAILLFSLRWLEFKFIILDQSVEIYIACIAIIFTLLGIWLALKLKGPRTIVVEKEVIKHNTVPLEVDEKLLNELGISKRELEVLQLMANGMSNQEIAESLFVSLNTVKTHGSNLFEKLEVKRRTQAIEKAKRLSIIP